MTPSAFTVALLGAESTGKTTLAAALAAAFAKEGDRVVVVAEALREFCDREARTPRVAEQAGIAAEQGRRIDAAAASGCDLVIADTTALMIAVYSDLLFGDASLYAGAVAALRRADLVLVLGNDLAWRPDGLQRDGPHVREPVRARIVAALDAAAIAWRPIEGLGEARTTAARDAVRTARASARPRIAGAGEARYRPSIESRHGSAEEE